MDVCVIEVANTKNKGCINKARLSCCEADWSHFKALKKEVIHMLKSHHKTYLMDMISSPNKKKPLWHYTPKTRTHWYWYPKGFKY